MTVRPRPETAVPAVNDPFPNTASPSSQRYRRLSGAALATVLAVAIVAIVAGSATRTVPARPAFGSAGAAEPPARPEAVPLHTWWPKRVTLLTDSVGLGAVTALRATMPDWHVQVLGHPALMVNEAADDLAHDETQVNRVTVVALGYNSLWERSREDFDYWSGLFDRNAMRLVRTLHTAGARKIVWVLLRDAPRSAIEPEDRAQHDSFAWYFPWVNQRLRALDRERMDVVLADWTRIGDRSGLTYDAIHLDPDGASLYARMVEHAILTEPYRMQP
jgi:hypothetical protein